LFVREAPQPAAASRPRFSLRAAWRESDVRFRRYLAAAAVFALGHPSDMLLLALCWERMRAAHYLEPVVLAALPLLWAYLHVVRTLGAPLGGRLSDSRGRVPVLVVGWLTHAASMAAAAVLAAGAPPLAAIALFTIHGLATALREGPERALVADLTGGGRLGTGYGLLHFVQGVATLPASVLVAGLWSRVGGPTAFASAAALAVLGASLLLLLMRGARPSSSG
jgi:MFS family permease